MRAGDVAPGGDAGVFVLVASQDARKDEPRQQSGRKIKTSRLLDSCTRTAVDCAAGR
jgi:hypothetical protein